ncbi:hypothetical protein SAMN05216357_106158 [Porphyromonadaceae bacterium KH3CP3RA]|nr:hypothetical protein SAMN05216357_106158 [Porphyromonadaceae bacterium KH3CP3RA]
MNFKIKILHLHIGEQSRVIYKEKSVNLQINKSINETSI